MGKEERFEFILGELKTHSKVDYDTLAVALDVSAHTIRRDIDLLHDNGLVNKVRGGAMPIHRNPVDFVERALVQDDAKKQIALKAQRFIKDGDTLFLDGGTTNCLIAQHLPLDKHLRIITNNLALVPILAKRSYIELILLGGRYYQETQTTFDYKTCEEASKYVADVYFFGACALHNAYGVTSTFREEAELKRTMRVFSKRTIVLANSKKLETYEPFKVCDLDDVYALITELQSDDEQLNVYRDQNALLI